MCTRTNARALLLAFFAAALPLAAEEISVIAHPSVPAGELALSELQAYFTGDKKAWPGDLAVKLATQSKALPAFYESVLKMKDSEFKKIWLRLVLQDGAKPPADFTSDDEVLEFVSKTKGALGWVKKASVTDKVKVITVK